MLILLALGAVQVLAQCPDDGYLHDDGSCKQHCSSGYEKSGRRCLLTYNTIFDFVFDTASDPILDKTETYSIYLGKYESPDTADTTNEPGIVYKQGLTFAAAEHVAILKLIPVMILPYEFTLSVWFSVSSLAPATESNTLLQKFITSDTGFAIRITSDGEAVVTLSNDTDQIATTGYELQVTSSTSVISAGQWYNITAKVFLDTGTGNYKMTVYIDGATIGTNEGKSAPFPDDDKNELYIGNSKGLDDAQLGAIWQLTIWNYDLDDTDRANLIGTSVTCGYEKLIPASCLASTFCSIGQVFSGGSCQNCLQGCKFCMNQSDCANCQDQYCDSCEHFFENGRCLDCIRGFTLTEDYVCEISCDTNQYKVGERCENCDPACKTCSGQGPYSCLSCAVGFLLQEGQCKTDCDLGYYQKDSICIKCAKKCEFCSSKCEQCLNYKGECQAWPCGSGEYFMNGKCLQCDSTCNKCAGVANNCVECMDNGVPRNTGGCKCEGEFYYEDGSCKKKAPTATLKVLSKNLIELEFSSDLFTSITKQSLSVSVATISSLGLQKNSRQLSTTSVSWTLSELQKRRKYQLLILLDDFHEELEVVVKFTRPDIITDKLGNRLTISSLTTLYDPIAFGSIPLEPFTPVPEPEPEEEEDKEEKDKIIAWFTDVMRYMILSTVSVMVFFGVLVGKISGVWVFVNYLQVIGYLPLISVNFTRKFRDFLSMFNMYNALENPFELIIKNSDVHIPDSFDRAQDAAIDSSLFLINAGWPLFFILLVLVLWPTVFLLKLLPMTDDESFQVRAVQGYQWRVWHRLALEVYLPFVISSLIQFQTINSTGLEITNMVFACIAFGICALYPVLLFFRLKHYVSKTSIDADMFIIEHGTYVDEFQYYSHVLKILYYPFVFILPRLFYALTFIYVEDGIAAIFICIGLAAMVSYSQQTLFLLIYREFQETLLYVSHLLGCLLQFCVFCLAAVFELDMCSDDREYFTWVMVGIMIAVMFGTMIPGIAYLSTAYPFEEEEEPETSDKLNQSVSKIAPDFDDNSKTKGKSMKDDPFSSGSLKPSVSGSAQSGKIIDAAYDRPDSPQAATPSKIKFGSYKIKQFPQP